MSAQNSFFCQGIAQFFLYIFHYDQGSAIGTDSSLAASNNLLDLILIDQLSLPPSAPPTLTTEFPGTFGVVLTATFQVVCAMDFFGPDCTQMCISRDDSLGHFSCDPVTGNRVCLDGYTNVERNCTECEPSPECCESSTISLQQSK